MPTRLAEEFAAALIDAHRTRRLVAQTDAAAFAGAATPEDVAAVQSLVAAALGPVTAWKTAPGPERPMIAPIL